MVSSLPKESPPQVGVETELRSLLSLFAKKACAQYRRTTGHGNTPYLHMEYYHTQLHGDIVYMPA
jgi:hypothetical protein